MRVQRDDTRRKRYGDQIDRGACSRRDRQPTSDFRHARVNAIRQRTHFEDTSTMHPESR